MLLKLIPTRQQQKVCKCLEFENLATFKFLCSEIYRAGIIILIQNAFFLTLKTEDN